MQQRKRIFISSFHPLITRNILGTSLLDFLGQQDIHLVLFVREEKKDFFAREYGVPHMAIEGLPDGLARRDIFLRYCSLAALDTQTLAIKRKTEMRGSGAWTRRFFSAQFGQVLVRKMSSIFTPRTFWKGVFEKYRPDAVFAADIQNERDLQMLHEAKRRSVPTVGMVRSWDNLTAKGFIRCVPETLLVHNEIIEREAVSLHGVSAECIKKVGIPHYDRYIQPRVSSRRDFCGRIGADPNRRIVLYAPVGDRYLERNTVDRDVARILDQNLPDEYQIVVRLPPGDTVKDFEGRANAGRVIFDQARRGKTPVGALTKEDDAHLLDTLWWSDVVVVGPSTLCIDAALFDKPVVLIAFDGYDGMRPYYESVRRYYDYNHFQPILASGGARIAKNESELLDAIRKYGENPGLDSEGRRRIVAEELYFTDGKSTERLAETLLSSLGRGGNGAGFVPRGQK